MKKFLLALVFFFAALGITQVANAALFEPYVGYGMGKMGGSTTYTLSGVYYGARLAYVSGPFFIGGEYQGAKMTWDTSPNSDRSMTDLGAVIGYDLSVARLYATYFLSSENKHDSSGIKGTAIKAGVGFKLMQPIAMNIEYYMGTYTKSDSGSSLGSNVNANVIMANLSLPLEF